MLKESQWCIQFVLSRMTIEITLTLACILAGAKLRLTECLYSTSVRPQMRLHNYMMMKYITIK